MITKGDFISLGRYFCGKYNIQFNASCKSTLRLYDDYDVITTNTPAMILSSNNKHLQ